MEGSANNMAPRERAPSTVKRWDFLASVRGGMMVRAYTQGVSPHINCTWRTTARVPLRMPRASASLRKGRVRR